MKKTSAGLWIDHRRAVIVTLSAKKGEPARMARVVSGAERQLRRLGETPLKGRVDWYEVPALDSQKRAYMDKLNVYYDEVIKNLGDAEAIWVMGPGEAKAEFKHRLDRYGMLARVVGFQAADKISENEILRRTHQHFAM
jgi:hypothetical protein